MESNSTRDSTFSGSGDLALVHCRVRRVTLLLQLSYVASSTVPKSVLCFLCAAIFVLLVCRKFYPDVATRLHYPEWQVPQIYY